MIGKPPSEEEKFYIGWGRETLKKNLDIANSILNQLVTLNSALLGGSVLFLSAELVNEVTRWLAIALFLLALIVSFIGILPYEAEINLRVPEQIKSHKIKALKHKRYFIYASATLTATGFCAAIVGLAIEQVCA